MAKSEAITTLDEEIKRVNKETEEILSPTADKPDSEPSADEKPEETPAREDEKSEETPVQQDENAEENPPHAEETDNLDMVNAGMSDAYAGVLKRKEKEPTKTKAKDWPTPPKTEKSNIKVAGGKDIMEVFWNEMWKLVDDVVDWTVDRALDFVTFVLYPTAPKPKEKKEVEKADVFAAGQTVLENTEKDIDEKLKVATAAHAEVKSNLQKAMRGENPTWTQEEPSFFKQLVETNKKAQADPNSEEAKKIERFNKIPEVLAQMGENTKKITKIMISWSTLEEFLNPNTKADAIKAAKQTYKNDSKKLKEELRKINEIYDNPQKQQEMMEKSIAEKMRERTPALYENIGKIREAYSTDPEKLKTTIAGYLGGISSSLKDATDIIYEQMYQKQEDGSKNRKKAEESLNALNKAIAGFMLEDKPISEIQKSQNGNSEKDINVSDWSKEDMLRIFKTTLNQRK